MTDRVLIPDLIHLPNFKRYCMREYSGLCAADDSEHSKWALAVFLEYQPPEGIPMNYSIVAGPKQNLRGGVRPGKEDAC